MLRSSRWVGAFCGAWLVCAPALSAQWQSSTGPGGAALGAVVGSDVERYLRALALTGQIRPVAWGARPFTAGALAALLPDSTAGAHPWQRALHDAAARRMSAGISLFGSENSGFPWGANDGPMWQGRGATGAVGTAATLRWRGVAAVIAPVAFIAQNREFPLLATRLGDVSKYSDGLYSKLIDRPQRMGAKSYARLDPGESTISIQGAGLLVAVSTAGVGWGTGEAFPAILGANAGGMPHLSLGTQAGGVRIPGVGTISVHYLLGTMSQSSWSSVSGSDTYVDELTTGRRRIASGLSLSYLPAILPTLELGASRFFHSPYRSGSRRWEAWSKPLEGLFKSSFGARNPGTEDPSGDPDNQLAALFARWTFPSRGAEATVEVLRDDHNWDSRDFAQEPENNTAVLASIRAATSRRADRLAVLTLEYFDGDIRPIAQARAQGYLYINGGIRQGHTLNGQLLGAPIGAGAMSGQRVAWEQFTRGGAWRVQLQRWRTQALPSEDPEGLLRNVEAPVPHNHDWIVDGSVQRTHFSRHRALTLEAGIAWAGEFNFDGPRTNLYARAQWTLF